jgi:hypothetical protein
VGGQHHAPAALPTGKTQYALYRSLGNSIEAYSIFRSFRSLKVRQNGSCPYEHSKHTKANDCRTRSKISQPVSQSVIQPASQSANQSASQSVSQSASQPASQSVSQSVSRISNVPIQYELCSLVPFSALDSRDESAACAQSALLHYVVQNATKLDTEDKQSKADPGGRAV